MIFLSRKLFFVLLLLFPHFAFSGEVLRLRQGNVDPLEYLESKTDEIQEKQEVFKSSHSIVDNENCIIQFKSKIDFEERVFLRENTVQVYRYIPDDAFLVKSNCQKLTVLKQDFDFIRAVIPYDVFFKLDSSLRMEMNLQGDTYPLRVTFVLFDQNNSQDFKQFLKNGFEVYILAREANLVLVTIPKSLLYDLASSHWVEYVIDADKRRHIPAQHVFQKNKHVTESESFTGYENGTYLMNFQEAWSRGFTGVGQLIGIADTGLDKGDVDNIYPDFLGQVLSGTSFSPYVKSWFDYIGHGTYVASLIAGKSKGYLGGAYGAKLHIQNVYAGPSNDFLCIPGDLGQLFEEAYHRGVRIHNNAYEDDRKSDYTLGASQADHFVWNHLDFLPLFAAGNLGRDEDRDGRVDLYSIVSPASAKNVIAVGASENYLPGQDGIRNWKSSVQEGLTSLNKMGFPLSEDDFSDNPRGIFMFSSRGPTLDGRIKPDVVAPGTNIVGVCSTNIMTAPNKMWKEYEQNYCYGGGTTASVSLVSAAAAVVRQALMTQVQNPSAAIIKAILLTSADDFFPGQFGLGPGQEMLTPAPNPQQGYGFVNVGKATDLSRMYLLDHQKGVIQGDVVKRKISSEVKKITLVYMDPPASLTASKALVNNLDLSVTLPDGEVLSSHSVVDNVEQVVLPSKSSGVEVHVLGVSIPQGKGVLQDTVPFALVAY